MLFYCNDSGGGNDIEEYDVKYIQVIQTHREGNIISAYAGL